MKFTKYIITTLLALFAANAAMAQVNGFALGSTNNGTTLAYAVISPRGSRTGVAPRIQYLNVGSDLATSRVQFYTVTAQTAVTGTNSTVTLTVNRTNGFASGDVIIIRHYNTDSYERRVLTTMTTATALVMTTNPYATVIPGDIVYRVTTAGAGWIPVGATTNAIGPTAGGIYIGQQDMPLLLEVNATSTAGQISVVSGDYLGK